MKSEVQPNTGFGSELGSKLASDTHLTLDKLNLSGPQFPLVKWGMLMSLVHDSCADPIKSGIQTVEHLEGAEEVEAVVISKHRGRWSSCEF